jgi:DNA repair protein RecN (Recombination protein N)
MIHYIGIRDFAIIKNISVEFGPGLSIITGETGSGKSIVVTAISLALGSRADSSYIRHGKEKAFVELAGDIGGKEIVISREISSKGKNICRLNGNLVTVSELAYACRKLCDIHGQYDNQSLLDPSSHLKIIDEFGGADLAQIKSEYLSLYTTHLKALDDLIRKGKDNSRKHDFYLYEIHEIDAASLTPGEDEALQNRLSILKNSEKIFEAAKSAYASLAGPSGSHDILGEALPSIEELGTYSLSFNELYAEAEDIYYRMEEVVNTLRDTFESMTFSPDELDRTMERLSEIDLLKKKYGGNENSITAILSYRDQIASDLDKIENYDIEKKKLSERENKSRLALAKKAAELTSLRKISAHKLSDEVMRELRELDFQNAQFDVSFTDLEDFTPEGKDACHFLISMNMGEPLKPLEKTASGGEISRIMLAIKNITASYDEIETMIFDEIDQGISGRTASIVGKKLQEIAKASQIICITHLPQIAAFADNAYKIYKESDGDETSTNIVKLCDNERIDELARLLGGDTISPAARRNAEDLLKLASMNRTGK